MGIFRDRYSVYQKERDRRGERKEKGVWWVGARVEWGEKEKGLEGGKKYLPGVFPGRMDFQ